MSEGTSAYVHLSEMKLILLQTILGNYNYLVVGDIKSAFNRFLMCTPIPFEFPCMLRL